VNAPGDDSSVSDALATARPVGPALWSPTEFIEVAKQRLVAAFDAPVSIVGVVIESRDSKGFLTVTLGDVEPQGRFPTRLAISFDPRTARRILPEALEPQAQVQVDGTVDVWVNRAQIQLRGADLVRVGSAGTQAAYDAALRTIGEEQLGHVVPPLPLFVRRVLLLAPVGTTLGDLTRDLGGWQPPTIVHRSLPGDSPDLGRLVEAAVAAAREDGEAPFDLVAIMRGGAIEPISGWDDVGLLRTIDALQRAGQPVLVAVGHADHTPLVYRVAGYGVRHTAEAGRWLADHNLGAATRIRALALVPAVLAVRLEREADRIERTAQSVGRVLIAHLGRRREALARSEDGIRRAVVTRLRELRRRLTVATGSLEAFTRGMALVTAPDGGPAVLEPGATLVIETADATVTATIDRVEHHHTR
jgi:exonuclease VII large subunit